MRLIKLSANKKSFHPIKFNPKGLSLILGRSAGKKSPASDKETNNGLGKSLAVRLVHFCLGADKIPVLEKKLPDWEFTLEFEHAKKNYKVTRKAVDQGNLLLNGEKIALKKYRELLSLLAFNIEDKPKYLSFRTLITHFIRPTKQSYLSYDQINKKEPEYQRALSIGYLLGLDIDLMLKKVDLRAQQERTEELRKNIESDEVFRAYFLEGQDYKADLLDTKEKLAELQERLAEFRVARDYESIQAEADEVNRVLRRQRSRASLVATAIDQINERLSRGVGLSGELVVRLYREAGLELRGSVVRTLEQVQSFHEKLIKDRTKRLGEERRRFEKDAQKIEREIDRLSKRQDGLLQVLNTHGALDEFVALGKQQAALKSRLDKLTAYEEIIASYKKRLNDIKLEFSQQNVLAENFLQTNKLEIDELVSRFRKLTREFYEDKPGMLDVRNNVNVNRMRFDVEAHITDDVSDGINEVKLFCFDWLLLASGKRHNMEFVFHDSRLLANMDPRQRTTLFRVAVDQCAKSGAQYIISANQDMLDPVEKAMGATEFQSKIMKHKVLELTDESDASRLLGIHVDFDYEDEEVEA